MIWNRLLARRILWKLPRNFVDTFRSNTAATNRHGLEHTQAVKILIIVHQAIKTFPDDIMISSEHGALCVRVTRVDSQNCELEILRDG